VEERLAARQLHGVEPQGFRLLDDRFEKRDIERRINPLAVLELRLDPAVPAGKITAFCQVKIDAAEGIIQSASLEEYRIRRALGLRIAAFEERFARRVLCLRSV